MQNIAFVVSILFFIALGYSIFAGDTDNALFQIVIGSILFIYFLIFRIDNKRNKEFIAWLRINNKDLGMGLYNGIKIDENTQFLQYELCLSLGFLSFRRRTGYYIKDLQPTFFLNFLFTIFSFLFGWWSLPMGPINTLRTIGYNLFSKPKRIDTILKDLKQTTQRRKGRL